MTTKRFLLDLLDADEFRIRDGQDKTAQQFGNAISNLAAYKQIKLNDIDRARAWIEKVPDKP
jgi:hypothetical protein